MRVLLPDGEEKGAADPRFTPPATTENTNSGAGLAQQQQQQPRLPGRSPTPLATAPPAEAPPDRQPSASNGKQRLSNVARPGVSEPSTDNDVGVEGDVKDDGRDVDAKRSTATTAAPEAKRAAAGTSACDASAAGISGTSGGGSGSGVTPTGGLSVEDETEDEMERAFEAELRAKGWELRRQEGDGNCLFRAISQHIYGDPGMHGDIRRQCLDFMRKERDHYSQFVSEAFDSYVSRKEKDGVHGNNPEMQAASELFNRPIEVYVPEKGTAPINIFHGGYRSGNAPIRVSYHGGNHYNAVIDPEEASVGQGLGIPGLSKEAAEKESLKRALAESCGRATQEELEQAAITASLAEFHGTSGSGGASSSSDKGASSFSLPRRGGRGVGVPSGGRFVARGAARGSVGRGEWRGGGAAWAGGAGSPVGIGSGAGRTERGGWSNSGGEGGGSSSSSSSSGPSTRKRRRTGSPPGSSSQRKASPGSADSSTSSAVREMVWSYGFPLARVLHAHDLVGDSVEDMLVLLTSDDFQPPETGDSGATAASFSSG
eukprot:g11940.t2